MTEDSHAEPRGSGQGAPPGSAPPGDGLSRTLVWLAATAFGLLLLWLAGDILLLIFAGALLAVLLQGAGQAIADRTPLPYGWSLALATVGLGGLAAGGSWLIAPNFAGQIDPLWNSVVETVRQIIRTLDQYYWGRAVLDSEALTKLGEDPAQILSRITGLATTTFNVIASFVVITFIGIYLAADPRLYSHGLLRLIAPRHRPRAAEVLKQLANTLRWWLIGRALSMIVIGAMIGIGLWALGVSLALSLGILSGLLNFIPYIGPIVAAVPGVLVGLADGPTVALWVLMLYVAAEAVESYLLTPIVLQRTVELPPALTIAAQLLGGLLFGIIGIMMATPLAAAGMVLVRMLYVEDVLGDRAEGG